MYSKMLYGSYARGDVDSYSDKDLAIFSDSENISSYVDKYTRLGWSCAVYSYKEIEEMAKKGYLFVQHLKQDGKILFDAGNHLRTILNNFVPKKEYIYEIEEAKNIFSCIKYIVKDIDCILWALDILSISLRNYLIVYYGNKGIYEYSTRKLYKMFIHSNVFSKNDIDFLLNLREYKYIYRNRHKIDIDLESIYSYYNLIVKLICTNIGFDINTVWVSKKEFIEKNIKRISTDTMSGYQRVRIAEMIYTMCKVFLSTDIRNKYETIFFSPHFKPYPLDDFVLFNNTFNELLNVQHFFNVTN